MPSEPPITFHLYGLKNVIADDHPLWQSPLPLHRLVSSPNVQPESPAPVNYGHYFRAVEMFLKKNHSSILSAAVSRQIERTVNPGEIQEIRVCLEKHGPFYHPARIDVGGADFSVKFVLNVAISAPGKACIEREYGYIENLRHVTRNRYLPEVYGKDDISITNDIKFGMFLGEWFDGFHEFHLSRDPSDHTLKIKVWHPEHGDLYLGAQQCRELYRRASRILATFYNVETTEHISSWHHASGDFIIKLENNTVDVKLITVRSYESALLDGKRDAETIMNALLVFFLNLTIRMRLDRLDGIGDFAWSDNLALPGSVLGFMEGLSHKPGIDILPAPIDVCFIHQLSNLDLSDLMDISRAILDTRPSRAPEVSLIKQHLHQHLIDLRAVLNDFGGPLQNHPRA